MAKSYVYSSKKIKALFLAFKKARIQYLANEDATSPDAENDLAGYETAFLQPTDMWVGWFVNRAGAKKDAKIFVETFDWEKKKTDTLQGEDWP